jgi:membrane-bound lytic murein transglycosylase B
MTSGDVSSQRPFALSLLRHSWHYHAMQRFSALFSQITRRSRVLLATALLCAVGSSATAQSSGVQTFEEYLQSLWPRAQQMGVSRATFDRVVPTLTFNPRVVQLDRNQADETPVRPDQPISPFAPYRRQHVDTARINGGRAVYTRLRPQLQHIEQREGVPGSIVVAIFGHETNYGRVTGNFDLPRSLATLAYDGRRRNLFETEFLSTLVMMERGAPREALIGSWAGAFGYPQFLPSVYLRMARDGDGDGRANIWNNEADALASIAHYLSVSGWRPGERWGYAVSVPSGLNRASIANRTTAPRCSRAHDRHSRRLTAREWQDRGVVFQGRAPGANVMLSLLEPDGPGQTAYLLTGSYRAILDYNCSNFYGLSVGLLADAVAN